MGKWKYKVVVTDYEFTSLDIEKKELARIDAQLIPVQCKSEDDLIEVAHDADGLLNLYFGPISRRVMKSMPKCKVIARYGIGLDTIDIGAATELGIMVTNVPGYCIDEVSDHAMALLLTCARKICLLNSAVKQGKWDFKVSRPLFRLKGKVLGLVGFGKIPRQVCRKVQVFGLEVIACDPYISEDIVEKFGIRLVGLEGLLKLSDFISIHTPLTKETKGMFGEREFRLMKKTAFFINTARGGLVDNKSLEKALKQGWISGAAVDLIEGTPPFSKKSQLAGLNNLIITPHTAWYSEESIEELQRTAAQEVVRVLKGQEPKSLINPEVLERS